MNKQTHANQELAIILSALLIYSLSFATKSNALNLAALLLLMTQAALWAGRAKKQWPFFIYFFGIIFAAISGFLVELKSIYMFEIMEHGKLTGAAARYISLMIIFLGVALISFEIIKIKIHPPSFPAKLNKKITLIAFATSILPIIYLLYVVLEYGSPLLMGIDRFSYWTEFSSPYAGKVRYLAIPLSFIISLAEQNRQISKKTSMTWMLSMAAALILNGEKLSGLIMLLFFYLIPKFELSEQKKINTALLAKASITAAILLSVVLINYYAILGDLSSAMDLFFARLALQGQMNYALTNLSTTDINHDIIKNLIGINSSDRESGIHYLMYLIAPENIVNNRIDNGTTFTAPFPANILIFFHGFFAPLAVAACSFLVSIPAAFMTASTRSSNFPLALISMLVFYYSYGAILMGNIHKLFELKFLLAAVTVLAIGTRIITPTKTAQSNT